MSVARRTCNAAANDDRCRTKTLNLNAPTLLAAARLQEFQRKRNLILDTKAASCGTCSCQWKETEKTYVLRC